RRSKNRAGPDRPDRAGRHQHRARPRLRRAHDQRCRIPRRNCYGPGGAPPYTESGEKNGVCAGRRAVYGHHPLEDRGESAEQTELRLLDPADLRTKVVQPGLWFFPQTPDIDENGSADFKPMYEAGLIKQIALRKFDETRQYLWPIPTSE